MPRKLTSRYIDDKTGLTGIVPINLGGTNATSASAARTNLGAIASSEKGAANGLATLDATGKLVDTQLPVYLKDHATAADPHNQYVRRTEAQVNYAAPTHTHTTTDVTDIVEEIQDIIGATVVAGPNITAVYDDNTGEVVISAAINAAVSSVNGKTGDVTLTLTDVGAEPAGMMLTHNSELDPHPQYALKTDIDANYSEISHTHTPAELGVEPAGVVSDHAAELDPHPQYLVESEGDARYAAIVHTHTASNVTDMNSAIDARMATTLVAGDNIVIDNTGGLVTVSAVVMSGGVDSVNGLQGVVVLDAASVGAEIAGAVATHAAEVDPHPQYLVESEGDARYAAKIHEHTAVNITDLNSALGSKIVNTITAGDNIVIDNTGGLVKVSAVVTSGGVDSVNGLQGAVVLDAASVGAEVAGTITAHIAEVDPHPQYLVESEGDVRYTLQSDLADVVQTAVSSAIVAGPNITVQVDPVTHIVTLESALLEGTVTSVNGLQGDVVLDAASVGAEVAGAVAGHVAASNPHNQYLLASVHNADADPHTQYLNETRGDARYIRQTDLNDQISDRLPLAIIAGDNISTVHDDVSDTITVSASVLTGGVTSVNGYQGVVMLTHTDVGAEPVGVIATHAAELDPHPQYLVESEGDARYEQLTTLNTDIKTVIGSTIVGSDNITVDYDNVTGQTEIGLSSLTSLIRTVNGYQGDVVLTHTDVGAEVAGAVATHAAEVDPHTQYLNEARGDARYVQETDAVEVIKPVIGSSIIAGDNITVDYDDVTGQTTITASVMTGAVNTVNGYQGDVVLTANDVGAEPVGVVATHAAEADPHTQYLNETRGDARYAQIASLNTAIDSRVPDALVAGPNITLSYDPGTGKTSIAAAVLTGSVDSVNGKTGVVTITTAELGAEPAGTAEILYNNHIGAPDPHPQYMTQAEGDARYPQVSLMNETIQDVLATTLVAGNSMEVTYNDAANTLTIGLDAATNLVTSINGMSGDVVIDANDFNAEPAGSLAAHMALSDPHPQYMTQAEGDVKYMTKDGLAGTINDVIGSSLVAGNNISLAYDSGLDRTSINATPNAKGYIVTDVVSAANQVHTFSIPYSSDFNGDAYGLKEEPGTTAQNVVVETFDAANASRYNTTGLLDWTTTVGQVGMKMSEPLVFDAMDGAFYKKTLPSEIQSVMCDNIKNKVSIIPFMGGNTSPTPYVASASSIYSTAYQAWEVFHPTNDYVTGWMSISGQPPTPANPQWLAINIGSIVRVVGYGMVYKTCHTWIFQGSLDGSTWVDLDSVANDTNYSTTVYTYRYLTQPVYYQHYRVLITGDAGTSFTRIGKLQLYDGDITAVMTSNTLPAPYVASASSIYNTSFQAWNAFNKSLNDELGWLSANTGIPISASAPEWLAIDLGIITPVTAYAIENAGSYVNTPKDWIFQGSLDGTIWIDLDTVSDSTDSGRKIVRTRMLSQPATYRYYRIYITAINQVESIAYTRASIGEFKLFNDTKILFKDDTTYYTITNNTLSPVTAPTSAADIQTTGILPNFQITATDLADKPGLSIITAEQYTNILNYVPKNQLLVPKLLSLASVYNKINSATLSVVQTGVTGIVKLAISRNLVDWYSWDGTEWINIGTLTNDTASADKVMSQGMTDTVFTGLTTQWQSFYASAPNGKPDRIAVAMAMGIQSVTDVVRYNQLTFNIDYASAWTKKLASEIIIQWYPDRVTFKPTSAGNYKLAYQQPIA